MPWNARWRKSHAGNFLHRNQSKRTSSKLFNWINPVFKLVGYVQFFRCLKPCLQGEGGGGGETLEPGLPKQDVFTRPVGLP